MDIKITYIVMVYNEVETIKQAVLDVVNIPLKDKEILVFDNHSNDGTVDILKDLEREYPDIKFIFRENI